MTGFQHSGRIETEELYKTTVPPLSHNDATVGEFQRVEITQKAAEATNSAHHLSRTPVFSTGKRPLHSQDGDGVGRTR